MMEALLVGMVWAEPHSIFLVKLQNPVLKLLIKLGLNMGERQKLIVFTDVGLFHTNPSQDA